MTNPTPHKARKTRSEPGDIGSILDALIDAVGRQGPASAPSSDRAGPPGPVLLNVERDGVRCLLVRTEIKAGANVALSPREQEIARMVARGYPNKIIADVLEISAWTVCTHMRRIFTKLGVGSRAAMVAKVLEGQLLDNATPLPSGPCATRVT